MVLAFASALGGGIIRDVLIGAAPPRALRDWRYPDWRYPVFAFTGGAIAFVGHSFVRQIPTLVIIDLDALGLSLFAVAGTEKALEYGLQPLVAVLMGAITGVGGGTVRDVLLTHVPAVLRIDVYATAALAGSVALVAARKLGLSPTFSAFVGGACCFALRIVSTWQHWNLPKAIRYQW